MKLLLLCTAQGLKPMYDSDLEEKRKLKIGETYAAEIKRPRNYRFHKKYFGLIRMAHHNLPEEMKEQYPTEDKLRKSLQVMAGYCEISYTMDGQELLTPTSISFSSMDEDEFSKLYNGVLNILLKYVFVGQTYEMLENELSNFM